MKPEDVFTPRAADVNHAMYVHRGALERALRNGLRQAKHVMLFGESGTGKSWLYKKVFEDGDVYFEVANLGNASSLGSIRSEFTNLLAREGDAVRMSYEESKEAELGVAVAKAGVSHTASYEVGQAEPFEALLKKIRARAKKRQAVLVLDNLESAQTDSLRKELADLLMLCDDARYAQYGVRVLVVGVPHGVREYFYNTPNPQSITNRLNEMPEITRLTTDECNQLVERGFRGRLKYRVSNEDYRFIAKNIAWLTDRIPLLVHELCLLVAFECESDGLLSAERLVAGARVWLSQSLASMHAAIEHHMNDRDTRTGRRNQVLLALGKVEGEQFRALDVERIVRKEFPESTKGVTLNTGATLNKLTEGEFALIRRAPKGNGYVFANPRFRAALRVMLEKTTTGTVEKVPLSDAGS